MATPSSTAPARVSWTRPRSSRRRRSGGRPTTGSPRRRSRWFRPPDPDPPVGQGHRELVGAREQPYADEAVARLAPEGGLGRPFLEIPELDRVLLGHARDVPRVAQEAERGGRRARASEDHGLVAARPAQAAADAALARDRPA